MSIIACTVDGCETLNPKRTRGMCPTHYSRWLRTRPDSEKLPPKVDAPCDVDDCDRERYGRMEICTVHYKRLRRNGTTDKMKVPRTCTVIDCDSPRYGHGHCLKHYKRFKKYGTISLPDRELLSESGCVIPDCEKPHFATGLCSAHYTRKDRTGDPLTRKQGEVVDGKRICPKCEIDKPLGEWSKALSYCRQCASDLSVERLKNHPRRAEIQRNANLRRRARKMSATIEKFTRDEILERDGWVCGICSESIDKSLKWPHIEYATIDHIIPLARGGEHSRKNVQAAHFRCNCSKKDSLPSS